MTDEKQKALVKLLLGFPSMATADKATTAGILASYLETLSNFSSEVVCAACEALRKRAAQFPPTAGEVHAECIRQDDQRRKIDDWRASGGHRLAFSPPRLGRQLRSDFTHHELSDWEIVVNGIGEYVMRVDAEGLPLRIPDGYPGAGQVVEHGYLTPREAREVAAAQARKSSRRQEAA